MKNVSDKRIINNNAENIKAPTTLTSLKYTQNWLEGHYNRQSPKQDCT
jgi:hypothetical protein